MKDCYIKKTEKQSNTKENCENKRNIIYIIYSVINMIIFTNLREKEKKREPKYCIFLKDLSDIFKIRKKKKLYFIEIYLSPIIKSF